MTMCDTPKAGETWMRRLDRCEREVKILEEVVNTNGGVLYLVSYYSKTMCRRACETVSANELYLKPVKVVNYQLMTVTKCGNVEQQAQASHNSIFPYWTSQKGYDKTFIQRTEVIGDKIEVFFEEMLP